MLLLRGCLLVVRVGVVYERLRDTALTGYSWRVPSRGIAAWRVVVKFQNALVRFGTLLTQPSITA